jgi:hypothetical protein
MGLESYAVNGDHFEAEDLGGPAGLAFPCCVCVHRHGTDKEEPCRSCGHNACAAADED